MDGITKRCRKAKRLWVKDTQTMWNIFKLVVPALHSLKVFKVVFGRLKERYPFILVRQQKTAI